RETPLPGTLASSRYRAQNGRPARRPARLRTHARWADPTTVLRAARRPLEARGAIRSGLSPRARREDVRQPGPRLDPADPDSLQTRDSRVHAVEGVGARGQGPGKGNTNPVILSERR